MATPAARSFITRELSSATWSDFEALFEKNHGVQAGCWCMFYRRTSPLHSPDESARREQNRRDQRELVHRGASRGILVYEGGRPVGWCQFGRAVEFPRIDAGRKYRRVSPPDARLPTWRITCFFVDRPFRNHGVAETALSQAIEAIRRSGGGTVEAYPATHRRAVAVWFGSVGMFRRQGFHRVSKFGQSNVLMRRIVSPVPTSRADSRPPRRPGTPSGPPPRRPRRIGTRRQPSSMGGRTL